MIKRIIPKEEVATQHEDILLFLDALGIHDYLFIEDENGTWRFRENKLQELLRESNHTYDLNRLAVMVGKHFRPREWVIFYMGMGYSLCGFEEIFGETMDRVLGILYHPDTGQELHRGEDMVDVTIYDEHVSHFVEGDPSPVVWNDPTDNPPTPEKDYIVYVKKSSDPDFTLAGVKYEDCGRGKFIKGDPQRFPNHGEFDKDRWVVNGRAIIQGDNATSHYEIRYCEVPAVEREVSVPAK